MKRYIWRITCTCFIVGLFAAVIIAASWTPKGPLPRSGHTAVLDTVSNKMIVFGGATTSVDTPPSVHFNDVWYLTAPLTTSTSLSWVPVTPTGTAPNARLGHSAVYDSASNTMVVFGGAEGFSAPCDNDLWAMTKANGVGGVPAWAKASPTGGPPAARFGHRAVYDLAGKKMIVFGGNDCVSTSFNDVWVLTNADGTGGTPTWAQLSPSGTAPAGRFGFGAVYDPTNNRLIIFGGSTQTSTFLNDVWVLTNANGTGGTPTWTQLSPSGGPPCAREYPTAVYDSTNNRMDVFGGFCSSPQNDAWVLTNANGLGGTPTWTQIIPTGTMPPGRFGHTAVFNHTTNRMVIFGGEITAIGNTTDTVSALSHANGL